MDLGIKIKKLRNEKGISQNKLAKELGVSDSFISRLENNDVDPSLKTLNKIVEYFKVELAYLLTEKYQWHKILPAQLQEFVKEENIEYLEVGLLAKEKELSPEIIKSIIDLISKAKKNKEGGREHEDRICRTRRHGSTDGRKPD